MIPILFILAGIYSVYAIYVIITIIISLIRGEKDFRYEFTNLLILISEIMFTTIAPAIGFMRYDQYLPDIPFAKQYVLIIIILVISSSLSFWLSRFLDTTKPMIKIFLSVGLMQGIILCGVISIHFIPFLPLGIMWSWLGFELLSPIFAFMFLVREFYFLNKSEFNYPELLPNRKELGFIPVPVLVLQQSFIARLFIYFTLTILIIILQVLIGCALGLDIDSLIKAFTHSHGFVFSMHN